eukprot:m.10138 g.10138  ORF g.10138 m.10138 type:complete len:143 (+) comp8141_c0_seq2:123-551(+)
MADNVAKDVEMAATTPSAQDDEDATRFEVELEFVQCLGNPYYLNFLAQRDYFEQPGFINYLKYLQYWTKPEYSKHIKYPHCLTFLDLLQQENFRSTLKNPSFAQRSENQQILHWKYYNRNRIMGPIEETLLGPESDDPPNSS